jgi:hypothetical protein
MLSGAAKIFVAQERGSYHLHMTGDGRVRNFAYDAYEKKTYQTNDAQAPQP